ncbi:BTB/POZ and MATH domain-containing protein 1-like [Miscanthus floridulus]|uniref:BTB/POZ and MATH domain-containing protein 1-like n=1 Tax=Miscanthus floridulus TaxID=154761 RepID=UPI003458B9ED
MASQARARASASICSSVTDSEVHTLEISDYSQHSDLGDGGYICSTRFTVGGHDWRIRYYPDGTGNGEECKDYVGVQLELMSEFTKVRLAYEFRLTEDEAAIKSTTVLTAEASSTCGTDKFKKKSDLPRYLRNDSLKIQCFVTVIKESQLKETAVSSNPVVVVQVPPSDLSSHLGNLLSRDRDDGDITFKVKSEDFRAHKLILDIRCPALKTTATQPHLDGQTMRDRRAIPDNSSTVVIQDMEPAVFKALRHFIYTDSLLKEHRNEEMAKSLLAAADKYDMKRMKLYCGNILSKRPTVDSVTTTIALAHNHHCRELKGACIQFINSSERTRDDVLSSEGYKELKATCPEVALEILENSDIFKKAVERQQDVPEEPSAGNHRGEARRGQGVPRSRRYSRNVANTHWSSDEE